MTDASRRLRNRRLMYSLIPFNIGAAVAAAVVIAVLVVTR